MAIGWIRLIERPRATSMHKAIMVTFCAKAGRPVGARMPSRAPHADRDRELANSRDNNVADSLSPARTNSGDTVGVAAREPLAFTAFAELFERVGARGSEHGILPAAAMVLCANQ
jgi:hypothetical protein